MQTKIKNPHNIPELIQTMGKQLLTGNRTEQENLKYRLQDIRDYIIIILGEHKTQVAFNKKSKK